LRRRELKKLILYNSHLPGVPSAALSQDSRDNCLEALRAHVRDLEGGMATVADVKLMVLGNGRVGKTQLCRRLRGGNYNEGLSLCFRRDQHLVGGGVKTPSSRRMWTAPEPEG
jgi:internalin A